MAISRSSATRTSRERPARFAAAATPVSPFVSDRCPHFAASRAAASIAPIPCQGASRSLRHRRACRGDRKIGEGRDRDARRLGLPGQEPGRARQRQTSRGQDQQGHQRDHRDHQSPAPPLFSIHRGLLREGGAALRGEKGVASLKGG
jgi:hypothetical protein